MKFINKINKVEMALTLLVSLSYLTLLIDTIKYPGAVANHFFIDAKVYFALSVTILLFVKTKTKILNLILRGNKILLPVVSTLYIILILLEGSHFRNYILNVLHIHIEGFIIIVLFSLSLYLADRFKPKALKLGKIAKIIYFTMVFFMVIYVAKNAALTGNMAFTRDSYILFHLRDTYDQRMFYEWGKQYQFMVFVRKNTPKDATIVIPPEQDPWLMGSGNDTYVRAFLFPRKIIQEIPADPSNTYVLIDWGKEECKPDPECHGWPRQNIKAAKIIYKDPDSDGVAEVKENTIYKLKESQYVYGLIEL